MIGWFKRRKQNPKRVLKDALGQFKLPSFPAVVAEAMRQLRDPNTPLGDIAQGLMRDPEVSVRLLRLANSPAYSLRHPVGNVQHAMSLLGRAEVESMLLSVAMKNALPRPRRGCDATRFWQASARRAAVARAIASKTHPASASASFTASLLQEMAVPLLVKARPKEYLPIREAWADGKGDLPALEREVLGYDHAVIGAAMCAEWGFPEELVRSIGGHHHDYGHGDEQVPPAVAIVARLRDIDQEEEDYDVLVNSIVERLGLPEEEAEELVDDAFDQADEVAAALAA